MGSGAGGYVRITLQTLLSEYDERASRLHRISELSFAGAPIPSVAPPKDIDKVDPGPPAGPQPAGKLGLGGVRPAEVERFRLFARMEDKSARPIPTSRTGWRTRSTPRSRWRR